MKKALHIKKIKPRKLSAIPEGCVFGSGDGPCVPTI